VKQYHIETRSKRFKLWHLFYLVSLYSAAFSLWGSIGVIPASLYIGLWLTYFQGSTKLPNVRIAAMLAAVFLFIVAIGESQVAGIRYAARRMSCCNNVRQIVLALLNFEYGNSHLPEPVQYSKDGEPWHSWRITVAPYLEHSDLFDRYHRNEAWNGRRNIKLLADMSWTYSCPSNKTETTTPYKLVTGPHTAFDDEHPLSNAGEHDSASSIIVLIEDVANPVPWLKPQDLSMDEAIEILSSRARAHCSHCIENKFELRLLGNTVGMLDGSIQFIPMGADPVILRQAMDPFDGIEPDLEFDDPEITIIKWQGYTSLGIFVLLLAIPIALAGRKQLKIHEISKTHAQ
jgi:hypothetical protein